MDTADTQAEAVRKDIRKAWDLYRAATGSVHKLNEKGQGSPELGNVQVSDVNAD